MLVHADPQLGQSIQEWAKWNFVEDSLFWSNKVYEGVKVPMPSHQVLPLTGNIFEASYSTSATRINKI